MEPLKEGTNWELKDSRIRTITNAEAEVSTPSGNYKAIEVTTKGPHGQTMDYYVKDIGIKKSRERCNILLRILTQINVR